MDQFNYAVALVSIITGLGLSDFVFSLHRLMKRHGQVRWDPLLIGLSTYLSFAVIRLWYQQWSVRDFPGVTNLPVVTAMIASLLLLVLALVASLPDDRDLKAEHTDLRAYYNRYQRYIWTLYLVYMVSWIMLGLFFTTQGFSSAEYLYRSRPWIYFVPPLALVAVAARTRSRPIQAAALILLTAHDAWMNWAFYLR